MNCRKNITGRKIWIDHDNAYKMRPSEPVLIQLLRDGEVYQTTEIDPNGDGFYQFLCLPIGNGSQKYNYTVDEPNVPSGYVKTVQGYNIINKLTEITITGTKAWDDNHNVTKQRPDVIRLLLLQNGVVYKTLYYYTPVADISSYLFTNIPFADSQGNQYIYTIDEQPVDNYQKNIDGWNITNKLIP